MDHYVDERGLRSHRLAVTSCTVKHSTVHQKKKEEREEERMELFCWLRTTKKDKESIWHATKDEGEKTFEFYKRKRINEEIKRKESRHISTKDVTQESECCERRETNHHHQIALYWNSCNFKRETMENNLHGNCNFQSAFSSLFWQTNFPKLENIN